MKMGLFWKICDVSMCRDLPKTQLRTPLLLLQTGKLLRIGVGDGVAGGQATQEP